MKRFVLMNHEGWPGIEAAITALRAGALALDVVEESIKLTEREERVHTVGFGGAPNALGVMQLDASCMRGDTLEAGAVAALEGFMHPISVARKVMERLPHVMLVGAGAGLFAEEVGFERVDILSPSAKLRFEQECRTGSNQRVLERFASGSGENSHGTVISLVGDGKQCLAGGVSTSGWDYKYPGRVGDSAVIGAGLYVDNRYGAVACTHCGENAIRSALAHTVIMLMQKGADVGAAVTEALMGLRALKGGYQGQVVVYAVDREGTVFCARRLPEGDPAFYLFWNEGMENFQKVEAVVVG